MLEEELEKKISRRLFKGTGILKEKDEWEKENSREICFILLLLLQLAEQNGICTAMGEIQQKGGK